MSRLVVVSNRVAPVEQGKATAGGLAVAILEALEHSGGIWFGWSGDVVDDPNGLHIVEADGLTYATMDLTPQDHQDYYNGYSNATLWPLFHYRLDLATFSGRTREAYYRVNRLFAEKLAPLLQPDDVIWVHDYHLIPLGSELRRMGLRHRMGFFLHTPYPVPDILLALPGHDMLTRALCAYDLVGFQTPDHLRAFTDYIRIEANGTVHEDGRIEAYGRTLKAAAFPISIDVDGLVQEAERAARSRQTMRLRDSLHGRDMIIGVDRLDYSKGLIQRFEAVQSLLQNQPEVRGRVIFMQIAPPSRSAVREYRLIRDELEQLSGHINGRFAEFDWSPIRYLNKSFTRSTLAGFYRMSRVGLVTPLRDGMNLVAKEYVACQDPQNPGVLVLSRFAGAAGELRDGALIVNPYDMEAVARSVHRALTMPLDERKERYTAMMDQLRSNDIANWRRRFVDTLQQAPFNGSEGS